MKQKIVFILAFLVAVLVSYIYKKLMHLPISIFTVLVPQIIALGSVWLYGLIKNKNK